MASLPKPHLTPEEYLEIERKAEFKSEYLAGEMFAMSGGTGNHSAIAVNLSSLLWTQLRGRCRVFNSDLRARVSPEGLYTYPDLSIVCGAPQFADDTRDTLVNPVVIVEVLSPSTEAYDRGLKFEQYAKIETLRQYVLVTSHRAGIEVFTRQLDGDWLLHRATSLDEEVELASINCRLALREVYEFVEFA